MTLEDRILKARCLVQRSDQLIQLAFGSLQCGRIAIGIRELINVAQEVLDLLPSRRESTEVAARDPL